MKQHPDVPHELIARVRSICLGFPEAREEAAWVGVRWRIRAKTFAHVLVIDAGWPPAYAKAAGSDGPVCVLTFRSFLPEVNNAAFREHPFFKPVWWPDIAGMIFGDGTDWDEVSALLAASYRKMSPAKLGKLVQ